MKWMLTSCALVMAAGMARAHPVAQGAMEITIASDNIALRARVSLEEVFVANMYAQPPAASLNDAYHQHAGGTIVRHDGGVDRVHHDVARRLRGLMLWRFLGFLAMLRGSPRHGSQGGNDKNQQRGACHGRQ